jgi:hypothetical protein
MGNATVNPRNRITALCARLPQSDRREQESLTVNFDAGLWWYSRLLQAGGASRKNAMPLRLTIKFEFRFGGDIKLPAQLFIQLRQVKVLFWFQSHRRTMSR